MVFSSIPFLFYFLPIVLAVYYALRGIEARNNWLMAASLIFYTWGGGAFVLMLLVSITVNFYFGLLAASKDKQKRKRAVIGAVVVNISLLGYFKYVNFFISEVSNALVAWGGAAVAWDNVILPIGISFFTFHCMSYVFDVANGTTQPQTRFPRFILYVTLFPQLIAGPIVRYHDVSDQLPQRPHNKEIFYEGIVRFVHGLAKKVLLADSVGAVAEAAFALPADQMTTSVAWLGAFAYTMQLYFDFSAYSDMAIGLGKMFGFTLPENFRRPYSALSITDFWRRWHITLSNWIREYLYIPLGGNRGSTARTYVNLLIAFFLTGLWHGANWTFIIWGLYHGALLIIERVSGRRNMGADSAAHAPLRRSITLFLVLIGWVMFRSIDVSQAMNFYAHMFSFGEWQVPQTVSAALSHRNIITLFLAGTVFILPQQWQMAAFLTSGHRAASAYRIFLLVFVLPLVLVFIAAGTFSPFLYFQF